MTILLMIIIIQNFAIIAWMFKEKEIKKKIKEIKREKASIVEKPKDIKKLLENLHEQV